MGVQPNDEPQVFEEILGYPGARNALKKLCGAGCNRQRLIRDVLRVCDELKPKKRTTKINYKRRFSAVLRKLNSMRETDGMVDRAIQVLDRVELTDELMKALTSLVDGLDDLILLLESSTPAPNSRGPQYPAILMLMAKVREYTGKPLYEHVATLASAASNRAGNGTIFDAAALRSMAHRQKKKQAQGHKGKPIPFRQLVGRP